jgi:transcriptional regulator with XRE-family HTH domain
MTASNFRGIDEPQGCRMDADVAGDEQEMIERLSQLRQASGISLETLGFMIGTAGGHVSRYLRQGGRVTLANYIRIARALGYRSRIVFERVDDDGGAQSLNKVAHRVSRSR